ncbi:MAG: tyrosine-protein phosphatase [Treponema sp.]|nr:tyrosine-protein phosphatase [Treponema sp.]
MSFDEYGGTAPERLLPLKGLYNVRDLGGYAGAEGKQVRWGLLYRGGDLHGIPEGDRAVLAGRNLKTIVDFRGEKEKEKAPDDALPTVTCTRELAIEAGNILDLTRAGQGITGEALMEELYRHLVSIAREQYREFFELLAEPQNTPLLFHCSAGKDRTGLAAALILTALGVSRETVYADYMLSEEYLEGKYTEWIAASPHLAMMVSVRRSYLAAAFQTIDTLYGGTDRYLREEIKAKPERLRELYLK